MDESTQTVMEVVPQTSLISDLMQAGFTVQLLLLILLAMSVVSWAIVFKKRKEFQAAQKANKEFLDFFWDSTSFEQVLESLNREKEGEKEGPLSRIFLCGFSEIRRVHKKGKKPKGMGLDNLERSLQNGVHQELEKLEEKLNFLATTGSTAPFIGLLGTVLGIMNSFRSISQMGSASLASVAPGISEALFATAIGLFAAIPAVMAYNHLNNKVRKQENEMHQFVSEFLNIARLQLPEESNS